MLSVLLSPLRNKEQTNKRHPALYVTPRYLLSLLFRAISNAHVLFCFCFFVLLWLLLHSSWRSFSLDFTQFLVLFFVRVLKNDARGLLAHQVIS